MHWLLCIFCLLGFYFFSPRRHLPRAYICSMSRYDPSHNIASSLRALRNQSALPCPHSASNARYEPCCGSIRIGNTCFVAADNRTPQVALPRAGLTRRLTHQIAGLRASAGRSCQLTMLQPPCLLAPHPYSRARERMTQWTCGSCLSQVTYRCCPSGPSRRHSRQRAALQVHPRPLRAGAFGGRSACPEQLHGLRLQLRQRDGEAWLMTWRSFPSLPKGLGCHEEPQLVADHTLSAQNCGCSRCRHACALTSCVSLLHLLVY